MQKYIYSILILFLALPVFGQVDSLTLTLEETIAIAQRDGINKKFAEVGFQNSYWEYQSFLASMRPQLNLRGDLPSINRSIEPIILPDGKEIFINRSLMSNSIGFNLEQVVPLTGGRIFVNSGLRRLDLFSATGGSNQSYLSTPISVGFIQPLFAFNALKWEKRIAPLVFEESKKKYSEDIEQVAYQASVYFFEVLISQLNLEAAKRDKINADTLLTISEGRFNFGKIAETELLQIQLQLMRAEADVAEQQLSLQIATEQLRNFIGIKNEIAFHLIPPEEIPDFLIDATQALELANQNRTAVLSRMRRMLEADRLVARAKADSRPKLDLFASFGLSQTANSFEEVYKKPLDQEVFRLGFDIPIADWGKSKASRQIAIANAELIQLQTAQDAINFEREILVRIQQFQLVKNQVDLAKRAYGLSTRRLEITQKRYLIGKINSTDLNLAITQEASARRSYFSSLSTYWLANYYLRGLTLYDFETGESLVREK